MAKRGVTVARVTELAATGEYETLTAMAKVVGVTTERVRQIVRQHEIPWQDFFVRLEWECPGCGGWIRVPRSTWEHWGYMLANCRACAKEDRRKFCIRGHLRADNMNDYHGCLVCIRERARCVIEVRACEICHGSLNISRGALNQEQMGNGVGKYHYDCYNKQRPAYA